MRGVRVVVSWGCLLPVVVGEGVRFMRRKRMFHGVKGWLVEGVENSEFFLLLPLVVTAGSPTFLPLPLMM